MTPAEAWNRALVEVRAVNWNGRFHLIGRSFRFSFKLVPAVFACFPVAFKFMIFPLVRSSLVLVMTVVINVHSSCSKITFQLFQSPSQSFKTTFKLLFQHTTFKLLFQHTLVFVKYIPAVCTLQFFSTLSCSAILFLLAQDCTRLRRPP